MPVRKIEHVAPKGRKVTILIDSEDVKLYRRNRWIIHLGKGNGNGGLRQRKADDKGQYLHRLIVGAQPGQRIKFIDGNRFNFQKSNLRVYSGAALYSPKGRRHYHKSGDMMHGVYFLKNRFSGKPVIHATYINGKIYEQRTFAVTTEGGTVDGRSNGVKLSRAEAYRCAVCWRVGMALAHGELLDDRSMDIFFEEHPRLSPFPRPFTIQIKRRRIVQARIHRMCWDITDKRRTEYKVFFSTAGIVEDTRQAIFWVVGTLLHRDLMPDEGSIELLKKTIAHCYTPPIPEEFYANEADYKGAQGYAKDVAIERNAMKRPR